MASGHYIPARYHMIKSKIDIITITFSLKLPFLESIHVGLCTSTLNIYRTAMPYMSLKFFRLHSRTLSAEKGQRIVIG